MRPWSIGFSNTEFTPSQQEQLECRSEDKNLMGEVLGENGRKDLETALTDNFPRCSLMGSTIEKNPSAALTCRTAERMPCGSALTDILGSSKDRMDAKDFTWLVHPRSILWILPITAKACSVLKTHQRRPVPEVQTFVTVVCEPHCPQSTKHKQRCLDPSGYAVMWLLPKNWKVFK